MTRTRPLCWAGSWRSTCAPRTSTLDGETLEQRAQEAVQALELVREDLSVLHNPQAMAKMLAWLLLATAAALALKLLWHVTAGYDIPWRQVEAMLLEVAHDTPGVRAHPVSRVLQKNLSDTCVEYELRVAIDELRHKVAIVSLLHGRVQDVFAQQGVPCSRPSTSRK